MDRSCFIHDGFFDMCRFNSDISVRGNSFFPFFAVTFVEDLCLLWLVKPLQYVTLSSFTRFLDIGSLYLNVSFVFIRGV